MSQQGRTVDPVETEMQYLDPSLAPTRPPRMIEHTSLHSSGRMYQLHYGASSNISFLNHLHRSFNSLSGGNSSIRLLNNYSETLGQDGIENFEIVMAPEACKQSISTGDELPLSLSIEILEHFLEVHQILIPFLCPQALRGDLRTFYDPDSSCTISNCRRRTLLLVLATAALTTKHHKVVDGLISQFNKLNTPSDDNLTLESIGVDCLLIGSPCPSLRCH